MSLLLWGFTGLYLMLIISAIVLPALFGAPKPSDPRDTPTPSLSLDEHTEARKGKRVDPTRPTTEDWGGMLENFKRRG